jgi:hypothetical protein
MLPTKFRFIWPSGFGGEDFFKSANQKQELPVVAMFINRLGQNDQSLERTFHRCFLPSFCSFGWEVSEEKIKMRKVNGRRTPSDGKSSHCLWQGELKTLDWRMNMGNYYKGGWFILNIFWIKGWAGHSMTTTAASWQELLFSPIISYSPLPKIKWQYFSWLLKGYVYCCLSSLSAIFQLY